jgi:hypothetical protein
MQPRFCQMADLGPKTNFAAGRRYFGEQIFAGTADLSLQRPECCEGSQIPTSQPADAVINFGAIEFNPASEINCGIYRVDQHEHLCGRHIRLAIGGGSHVCGRSRLPGLPRSMSRRTLRVQKAQLRTAWRSSFTGHWKLSRPTLGTR